MNTDKNYDVQESKKLQKKNKKRVLILADNITKHLKGFEISSHIENCKVYGKGFRSAKTRWIKDYATRENPDHVVIYVDTNDLPTKKQPDVISEDIVELALNLKSNSCDGSVWNNTKKDISSQSLTERSIM